ncbi:MAG: TadE/TadG family type IV pilus assembly protein [Candidatus Sulfotelmatobacter sp.]|jgi:Flp pilus assembly protein TadG
MPALIREYRTGDPGSQIVEFALSLPILVIFVVGIFDFSSALSLKQKLTNAAREAARVAASDPANDLSQSVPVSVSDANQVVANYLLSEKINSCGLAGAAPTQAGLTWTSTAAGSGCPGPGITLTVNRGCTVPQPIDTIVVNLVSTCVTLTYPYTWRYNGVSGLAGTSFIGPTTITSSAVAFNEN